MLVWNYILLSSDILGLMPKQAFVAGKTPKERRPREGTKSENLLRELIPIRPKQQDEFTHHSSRSESDWTNSG
jgi:hypothetical protein